MSGIRLYFFKLLDLLRSVEIVDSEKFIFDY